MSTTISRSGTFDASKLSVLDAQLTAALGLRCQVYGSSTGFYVFWQQTLTASQNTQATTIINAYSQATDLSALSPLQQQAFQFLQIANPTQAQKDAALRGVIKYLLQVSVGKTNIDGTDIS